MRTIGKIFSICVIIILAGCSKNDNPTKVSLSQALNQSAVRLNNAMDAIVATKAYSIFTQSSSGTAKSLTADSVYKVYITLDKIKGIYDYQKVSKENDWGRSLIHFFTKTADDNQMIVRLPLQKVTSPGTLRHFFERDSSLTNNFTIAVSDYHNDYNSYWDYDYSLASEISIDSVNAGSLVIKSNVNLSTGIHYNSQYAFTGGYTARYKFETGDTTVSSFTILNGTDILYKEELLLMKNDTARFGHEHQYILTIGNVQIIRKGGTVQVAVNGVVEPGAKVTIIDKESDSEASVCKDRDVQITFEDGTVSTISALIGDSVKNIRTLYQSLHQVYFAAYIVDWIAYDIYYQR